MPLVVHFNGPAKVIYEREWRLPWDETGGLTPIRHLRNSICRSFSAKQRADAEASFARHAVFLDPLFRKVDVPRLSFMCSAL